jgi:hypothetical protein
MFSRVPFLWFLRFLKVDGGERLEIPAWVTISVTDQFHVAYGFSGNHGNDPEAGRECGDID